MSVVNDGVVDDPQVDDPADDPADNTNGNTDAIAVGATPSLASRLADIIIERMHYVFPLNYKDEAAIREQLKFVKKLPVGVTEREATDALFNLFGRKFLPAPMHPSMDLRVMPIVREHTADLLLERTNHLGDDKTFFTWAIIRHNDRPVKGHVAPNVQKFLRGITSVRLLPFNIKINDNQLNTYQFGVLVREFSQYSYRSNHGFRYNFVLPMGFLSSVIDPYTGDVVFVNPKFSNALPHTSVLRFPKPLELIDTLTLEFTTSEARLTLQPMVTPYGYITVNETTYYDGFGDVPTTSFTLSLGPYIHNGAVLGDMKIENITTTDPVADAVWIAAINATHSGDGLPGYTTTSIYNNLVDVITVKLVEIPGADMTGITPVLTTDSTVSFLGLDFKIQFRINYLRVE